MLILTSNLFNPFYDNDKRKRLSVVDLYDMLQ